MGEGAPEGGWKGGGGGVDGVGASGVAADQEAVKVGVAHVYAPWLRDAAELFQKRVKGAPLPGRETPRLDNVPAGTCVLFADGLRYDVGQKLLAMLSGRVGSVQARHQFVALPSVTPPPKPPAPPAPPHTKATATSAAFRPR